MWKFRNRDFDEKYNLIKHLYQKYRITITSVVKYKKIQINCDNKCKYDTKTGIQISNDGVQCYLMDIHQLLWNILMYIKIKSL